jgi:GH24 family phage-related lysozyme (muramidase)
LLFEMLRWVQILARRVSALAATLDRVETADNASILDLDVRRRVSEAALVVRSRASASNVLATDLERQPA